MPKIISPRFNKQVLISIVIITLLFWCTYDFPLAIMKTNMLARHFINYLLLLIVSGVGYYGWHTFPVKWIKYTWLMFYAAAILLLAILGIIDLLSGIRNESFRDFISSLRMFFTSPVPFGILMFLSKYIKTEKR